MTMQIRNAAVLAICVLLIAAPTGWAQDRPAMDIPIYSGGEAIMEINLSNEDILPMLKAMLPLLGPKFANIMDGISADDLAAVFKNVRRVQFLQVDIAKAGVAEKDVAEFYAKNLPKGSWNRVFWQSAAPMGTVAVYSQPMAEMIYAFRVRTVTQDGKSIKQAEVLKTEGQLDYVKLISLASKVMARMSAPVPTPTPAPAN